MDDIYGEITFLQTIEDGAYLRLDHNPVLRLIDIIIYSFCWIVHKQWSCDQLFRKDVGVRTESSIWTRAEHSLANMLMDVCVSM